MKTFNTMKTEYLTLKALEELQPDKFKEALESPEMQATENFDLSLSYALDVHFRTKHEELKFKQENVILMLGILLKRSILCS